MTRNLSFCLPCFPKTKRNEESWRTSLAVPCPLFETWREQDGAYDSERSFASFVHGGSIAASPLTRPPTFGVYGLLTI